MKLHDARRVAVGLRDILLPSCERIEAVGSVRRGEPEIGDIDLLAIPRMGVSQAALFEEMAELRSLILDPLDVLHAQGRLRWEQINREDVLRGTARHLRFSLPKASDQMVEVWLTTPERWGCLKMIRTGGVDFAREFVTRWKRSGEQCWCWESSASHLDHFKGCRRFHDGRMWLGSTTLATPLDTPRERDVFEYAGIRWVEPKDRSAACAARLRDGALDR